jgi:hypothetical protein
MSGTIVLSGSTVTSSSLLDFGTINNDGRRLAIGHIAVRLVDLLVGGVQNEILVIVSEW